MARIKFGSGVAEIRGSINGVTFSRNASGAYARNRTKGVNPNSQKQRKQRNLFGSVSRQWQLLSDEQRSSFQVQAVNYPYKNKVGETQTYTAFMLFQKVNAKLRGYDSTLFVDTMIPPVSLQSSVISEITKNVNQSELFASIEFVNGGNQSTFEVPDDCYILVSFSAAVSSGKYRPKTNAYRFATFITAAADTTTTNLWGAYVGLNGAPVSGQFAWIRTQLISTLTAQTGAYQDFQIAW